MKSTIKKTKYILLQLILLLAMISNLASCYDDKMEWGRDPYYGEVTMDELP